jgi:hypothetical protein
MSTTRRIVVAILAAAAVMLGAAAPAAANPRIEFGPFLDVFDDVNPCTGRVHQVRISASFFVHEHGDRTVAKGVTTISTSSGYVGRGTSSFIENGNILMARLTDILTRAPGDKIKAQSVFVLDIRSDTVRVDRFSLTCLGS